MIAGPLRLLGQHARWTLPFGVCTGLVLPALAEALHALVLPTMIGMITVSLLRLEWTALMATLTRPAPLIRMSVWAMLISPVAVWLLARIGLIPEALTVLSVLQAASAPIGSAAAFALFLGIPGHLCMAGTVVMTLMLPITLTATASLLLPSFGIQVDLGQFFIRVTLSALAPFLITYVIRRMAGDGRLRAFDAELAGLNVVLLVLFAIAIMNGVTETFFERPGFILGLFAWSCFAAAFWHGAGYLLLRANGFEQAMSSALLLGNRNLGLTLAVTAGTAGEAFQMYAGLAQIPLFCVPLLLSAVARR
jgi:ACR3 family arsenite efflux pump ArsB